eukprot:11217306-Lingulodinium_polyedra.AAC.1
MLGSSVFGIVPSMPPPRWVQRVASARFAGPFARPTRVRSATAAVAPRRPRALQSRPWEKATFAGLLAPFLLPA